MSDPVVTAGEIWREVDPRRVRFVRVDAVSLVHGASIRTVVKIGGHWIPARGSRVSNAGLYRFNGKRGGYELHESPTEAQS